MTGAAAPRARGGPTPTARHQDNLTHVELTWVEKKIENWIRFGTHAHEQILDRRRRVLSFRPGAVFVEAHPVAIRIGEFEVGQHFAHFRPGRVPRGQAQAGRVTQRRGCIEAQFVSFDRQLLILRSQKLLAWAVPIGKGDRGDET